MKAKILIIAVLFVLVGAQVIPVSAAAVKTPVSGLQTYIGDSDEQPNLKVWWVGHNGSVLQWKNGVNLWKWDSNDPRLCGYSIFEFNENAHWTADGVMNGFNSNAKETIYTNAEYTEPIWSCQFVHTNNGGLKEECQGVGKYKGLKARIELDMSLAFEGYILDPAGE